jgi:hypothetical protein
MSFYSSTLVSLILANLFPLFGVLYFKWQISDIIFFYWFENIIIGVMNVLKMAIAGGDIKSSWWVQMVKKSGQILFFTFHYGMFTGVHGVFVMTLFGLPKMSLLALIATAGVMVLSHGESFLQNYIGRKEYLKSTIDSLFMQPYGRIVVVHLTILLGAFFSLGLHSNWGALIVMVILKTSVDIWSHLRERKKFT